METTKILHVIPLLKDERLKAYKLAKSLGKTKPAFYHDAIVAYTEQELLKQQKAAECKEK